MTDLSYYKIGTERLILVSFPEADQYDVSANGEIEVLENQLSEEELGAKEMFDSAIESATANALDAATDETYPNYETVNNLYKIVEEKVKTESY